LDEARWVEAQTRDRLPVQSFHIVFTVPTELHAFFLTAPSVAYTLVFTAAAKTLEDGARRTAGHDDRLHRRPAHLDPTAALPPPHPRHRPGGGLDLEQAYWIPARRDFFLRVRVLEQYAQHVGADR
jgi:hypothetical protein